MVFRIMILPKFSWLYTLPFRVISPGLWFVLFWLWHQFCVCLVELQWVLLLIITSNQMRSQQLPVSPKQSKPKVRIPGYHTQKAMNHFSCQSCENNRRSWTRRAHTFCNQTDCYYGNDWITNSVCYPLYLYHIKLLFFTFRCPGLFKTWWI